MIHEIYEKHQIITSNKQALLVSSGNKGVHYRAINMIYLTLTLHWK